MAAVQPATLLSNTFVGVGIFGDTTPEPNETINATLEITQAHGSVTLGTAMTTFTILNDDIPMVNITAATVTFTMNPPRLQRFNIELCLGGTAERGSHADYQYTFLDNTEPRLSSGCRDLLILPDNPSFSRKIRVNGDSLFEDDETVMVSLRPVSGVGSGLGGNSDTPRRCHHLRH